MPAASLSTSARLAGSLTAVLTALALVPAIAAADPVASIEPRMQETPRTSPRLDRIPPACRRFASVPENARDDVYAWNQALSLAGCLQDTTIERVTDPEQLDAMVDDLAHRAAPAMVIYLVALEQAPGPIQLRAAYQIAMDYVALITRARASLVAPPDLATNPEAARRYRALHDQLEKRLQKAEETAWVSFAVIGAAVEQDPSLATDPVNRNMVRSARAMLEVMRRSEW